MITIVNYGMGNLGSVFNMFKRIGVEARIVDRPEDLQAAKKILRILAYPRRGTAEENMDAYQLAEMVQLKYSSEDLDEN